jgi:hypothetical protein
MIVEKIKGYALSIVALLTLMVPFIVPAAVSAASCSPTASGLASGANLGSTNGPVNCGSTGVGNSSVTNLAKKVVNLFSLVVGAISVIMIIYGGFRYITSGGATEKVGDAKKTLIYAIIGLIVVALAQLIIHFVLNQASNISTGSAA